MIQLNLTRILLAMAVLYILFLQMCGNGKSEPCQQIVSEKTDTQRLYRQWASSWDKPKPDTIILPAKTVRAPKPDTVYIPNSAVVAVFEPVDTAAILQDYRAKVVYHASKEITDGEGLKYGTAYVSDTVSENRIQARQWRFDLSLPVITHTVTVTAPPRTQLFLGFDGMFGQQGIGGDINVTLKDKRDRMYQFEGGHFHEWYFSVGTKRKLSFK